MARQPDHAPWRLRWELTEAAPITSPEPRRDPYPYGWVLLDAEGDFVAGRSGFDRSANAWQDARRFRRELLKAKGIPEETS